MPTAAGVQDSPGAAKIPYDPRARPAGELFGMRKHFWRLGLAAAATLLAWAARAALGPWLGDHHPFPTFYVAGAAAAWLGGAGPALLTLALSLPLAAWSFVPPRQSLRIAPDEQAGAVAFVL